MMMIVVIVMEVVCYQTKGRSAAQTPVDIGVNVNPNLLLHVIGKDDDAMSKTTIRKNTTKNMLKHGIATNRNNLVFQLNQFEYVNQFEYLNQFE